MRIHRPKSNLIISNRIGAVFIFADISPHHTGGSWGGKMAAKLFQPIIVKAEPVNHRFVIRKPEYARFGIAGLRQWRHGAALNPPEHLRKNMRQRGGVFIKSSRQPNRIWQTQTGQSGFKRHIMAGGLGRDQSLLQSENRQMMRRFRREYLCRSQQKTHRFHQLTVPFKWFFNTISSPKLCIYNQILFTMRSFLFHNWLGFENQTG